MVVMQKTGSGTGVFLVVTEWVQIPLLFFFFLRKFCGLFLG